MTLLHILKSNPDQTTTTLIDVLSEGENVAVFSLYEEQPDYGRLIDLIFESDRVITWW